MSTKAIDALNKLLERVKHYPRGFAGGEFDSLKSDIEALLPLVSDDARKLTVRRQELWTGAALLAIERCEETSAAAVADAVLKAFDATFS